MPQETRQQLPQIQGRATFQPDTFNADDNTIEVVFATETPVLRYDWWDDAQFFEVLTCAEGNVRMQRIQTAPVVDTHDTYSLRSQFGTVVKAWIDVAKRECRATIKLSSTEGDKEIVQKIKDGIIRNISVGYRVYKVEVDEAPENATATRRAVDWEPMEISFVPMPADPNSSVRSKDTSKNEVTIISKSQNQNTMPETNGAQGNEQQRTQEPGTTAPPAQAQPAAPAAPANDEQVRNAAKVERQRIDGIRTAARVAGITDETFINDLINNEVSLSDARAQIIDKAAETNPVNTRSQHTNVKPNGDETDKKRNIIQIGLCLRSGNIDAKSFKTEEINAAREYRSMSLLDLAKDALVRSGELTWNQVMGMDKFEVAKRAISSSSSDFPVLLEGTNRRILLAAYQAVADTWRNFCTVGSVSDFRTYKRLRMGSFGKLDKVIEDAEYKTKKIDDAQSETISAATYGNLINISRVMIINDDLAGFTRLAGMLGRAAARNIEIDVYALLAANPTMGDGTALFHASHGNLITSGGAPSVAQFDSMRVKMAQQKDPSGNDYLDIRPYVLVCGISNGGDARVINGSQYDPDAANKLQRPNKVNGLFSQIVDTARITGTEYYAFANPSEEPVIEVVFLDGVQAPYLESQQLFNVDGISWKVRLDYGVGAIGWRGVIKNPGA